MRRAAMSEPSSTRRGPVRGFLRTGTNRRGRNPRPGTWLIRAGASRFDPWLVVAILSLAVAILLAARVRAAAPRVVSIPPEAFVDADGVAWGVSLAPLLDGLRLPFPLEVGPTDDLAHATVSPHRLLEDGAPLSPAHSLHAEIFERGAGRHSFWVDSLLMSTSDNSDPRANGRTYQIELGVRARPWAILLGAGLALMPALWLLRHVRGRVLARLAAWCACIGSFALVAAILARPAWARCVEHLPPAILCVAFLGAASAGTAAVLLRIADRWRDRASPRPASLATRTAVAVARSATRTRRVFFCACAGRWRLGLATAMALAVASLLRWWAPLPPPVSQWPGVRYLAVAQGRIVDSDALEHWASSQWLRWQGELPRFAARRPLCATLMAAESSLGDGRMQVVLLLNTLLCGAAIWFVARAAGRSLGVWAGLATYAVLLGYAQHFLGLPMTESLGLSLGALGTGLLLRGVETRRPPIWSLGCFALSLGLFARAGAFFVLPAIVLALAWTARRSGRRAWIAPVAAAALAASSMTAAFVLNATVFRLTSDGGSTPNSNFAFVAFGLASGGTWTLGQEWIVQHMPMSTEAQQEAALYEETWKRIEADPTVLARSLHSALGAFVAAWGPGVAAHFGDRGLLAAALPSRWSAWLPANAPAHAIWSILGPLTLLLRLRRVGAVAILLVAAALGIVASMPVIYLDGGWRAVAPTMPLMTIVAVFFLADSTARRHKATDARGRASAEVALDGTTRRSTNLDGVDRAGALLALGVPLVILASALGLIGRRMPPATVRPSASPESVSLVSAPVATLSGVVIERNPSFRWFGPARMAPEDLWREIDDFGQPFPTGATAPRRSNEASEPVALLQSVTITRPPGFAPFMLIAPERALLSAMEARRRDEPFEFLGTRLGETAYYGQFFRMEPLTPPRSATAPPSPRR